MFEISAVEATLRNKQVVQIDLMFDKNKKT